jgi:site-specific DNA recombinase
MIPLRCAIYARYSSDRQSTASIADQIRKCREYATRQGWIVLEDHIFSDEAISGTNLEREGLRRLVAAATSKGRPFDCILIDDTSRLSRKLADALNLYEQLRFAGIRLVFVSQGVDSKNEQAELLIGVHGLIDTAYWRELASKTHRGMEGKALKGMATGGRCFGYETIKSDDEVHLKINKPEAETVVRIFKMYADGLSLKRIFTQLNAEGIASPQPQKDTLSRTWCTSSVRVILLNERYLGRLVWNKTQKVRVPGTGRRIKRLRPESEWVCFDAPHLRIISNELWSAVQQRFATVHHLWGRKGLPGLSGQQRSVYLFSGLLKCGVCGGSVTFVSGRWRSESQQYGCSMHHQRGKTVCSNRLTIRRDKLESRILAGLQKEVLREDAVDYVVAGMKTELERRFDELNGTLSGMRERKRQLETEIARLVNAIAGGNGSESIMEAIGERERELRTITDDLLEKRPTSIQTKLDELRTFAVDQLTELRQLLARPENVHEARALLARQIGPITLIPTKEGYSARGSVDFFGDTGLRVSGAGGQS